MFSKNSMQTRAAAVFLGLFSATSLAPIAGYGQDVEEIIVTARKREENLQDIGVSVTPITQAVLQQHSINSVRELARQVPGLTFQESFGRRDDRPGIRGQTSIGTIDFGVESGTAIFIDGIYINADTAAFGLHDLERVEIVRGPQSALYGRNAYAGSINFVTAPPSADEVQGSIRARYGSYGEGEASVSASGPMSETMAATFHARYYTYDGQFTNAYDGSDDVGDESTRSVAAGFFYTPEDNISMRARVAYSKDNDGHIPFTMIGPNADLGAGNICSFFPIGGRLVPLPCDGFRFAGSDDYYIGDLPAPDDLPTTDAEEDLVGPLNEDLLLHSGLERESIIFTARADVEFGDGYLFSFLGGYHTEDRQTGSDSASLGRINSGLSMFPYSDRDLEDYSLELRLDSPRDNRFRWGGGLFYYKEELTEDEYSYACASGFITCTRAESLEDPILNLGVTTRVTRNWAAYGSLAFDIMDNLTATAELRYAEDKKEIVGAERRGDAFTDNFFPDSRIFYEASARFLLEYKLNEDLLLYGSFARGNKPGGFNGNSNRDTSHIFALDGGRRLASFEEEIGHTIEGGFKASGLDNRFYLNGSGFFNNVRNAQLTQTFSWCLAALTEIGSCPTGQNRSGANIINMREVEIFGVELEAGAVVTDNLDVSVGYAWVDAEIKKGTSRDHGRLFFPFGNAAGNDPELSSVAGKKMPRISEHQVNFTVDYTHPVSWGEMFLNLNGAYESERFVQVSNLAIIPSSFEMNFRFGGRYKNYEVALWGKNIWNEEAPVDALRFRDGDFVRAFQIANRRGSAFGFDFAGEF